MRHSRIINKHKIQAPCAGLFSCPALTESFETQGDCSNSRMRYICSEVVVSKEFIGKIVIMHIV